MHGYALYKRILDITQMHWKPSIGTIYCLLNDIADRDLVLKSVKDRKHNYSITPKGIEYFIKSSRVPLTRKVGVLATVLEAYFRLARQESNIVTEDLKERLRVLRSVLEEYRGLIE